MILARLLAVALLAAAIPAAAMAQDARRGADLAAHRCANCHGDDGRSRMEGIPSLAGQPPLFIVTQMILFREGIRHVPAMQAFAAGLPDRDIEDLAAFFAALPPGPPEDRRPRDPALFDCASCHLPSLAGREQIPRLTAQREDFLARTMAEYRDGARIGADTQMNGAVAGLTDAQIAALAHYLSQRD